MWCCGVGFEEPKRRVPAQSARSAAYREGGPGGLGEARVRKSFVALLGLGVSEGAASKARRLFNKCDTSGDGRIQLPELLKKLNVMQIGSMLVLSKAHLVRCRHTIYHREMVNVLKLTLKVCIYPDLVFNLSVVVCLDLLTLLFPFLR